MVVSPKTPRPLLLPSPSPHTYLKSCSLEAVDGIKQRISFFKSSLLLVLPNGRTFTAFCKLNLPFHLGTTLHWAVVRLWGLKRSRVFSWLSSLWAPEGMILFLAEPNPWFPEDGGVQTISVYEKGICFPSHMLPYGSWFSPEPSGALLPAPLSQTPVWFLCSQILPVSPGNVTVYRNELLEHSGLSGHSIYFCNNTQD